LTKAKSGAHQASPGTGIQIRSFLMKDFRKGMKRFDRLQRHSMRGYPPFSAGGQKNTGMDISPCRRI
jgi:hypothetical protein